MARRTKTVSLMPDRRGPSRRWLVVLAIIALIVAGAKIATLVTGRTNPVDRAIISMTTPVVYVIKRIGEGLGSLVHVFRLPALLSENKRLETENALMERKVAEVGALARENERLRELAGLLPEPEFTLVNATVLARPYDLWLETALISAGSNDGLGKGDLVANELGIVGLVEEVQPGYSRVELCSSPGFRLGVIAGDSRDEGVLRGIGPGELALDYIPAGSKIAYGEKLFTRGESAVEPGGASRPRGIYCGMVTTRVAEGGYLNITVEPAANTARLGQVVVYTQ